MQVSTLSALSLWSCKYGFILYHNAVIIWHAHRSFCVFACFSRIGRGGKGNSVITSALQ